MVILCAILILGSIGGLIALKMPWFLFLTALGAFLIIGFMIVNPNESKVLVLFGDYMGTVKANGFFWVNPFISKEKFRYAPETLIRKKLRSTINSATRY